MEMNLLKRKKKGVILAITFILPVCLMTIVYIHMGIFPFGNKSLLTIDMHNQYVAFLSYLKEMISGNHSFDYSFSKGIGGNMTGLASYYMLSPFNLILCFWKTDTLPIGITVVTLLKMGCAGLSMGGYLYKKNGSYSAILFSLCYSMMSYNIVYQQNIMWLDGVILLPLICMGIENICKNNHGIMYMIALAGAILTNYYIGYMLCIFSVLYYTYNMLILYNLSGLKDEIIKRKVFESIFCFLKYSLFAGGLSAFVLVPTVMSLQGGKAEFSLSALNFLSKFDLIELLSKFYIGAFDYEQIQYGLPNIYCGGIILILVLGYFFVDKIKIKEKWLSFFMICILLVSFHIEGINLVWHALNEPVWFPYRYSFLFSFFLIVLAEKAYGYSEYIKSKVSIILSVIVIITLLVEKGNYTYLSEIKIYFTVFVIACVLFFISNCRKKFLLICILAITCLDLFINAIESLEELPYYKYTEYNNFVKKTSPAIDEIKNNDKSFFRIEKTFAYDRNDSMLLDYKGITHYSSTEKQFVKDFLGSLGYRNYGTWVKYNQGSTTAADSLMGIKYILSQNDSFNSLYNIEQEKRGIKIYENKYWLPLGFSVNDEVEKIAVNKQNVFELQNMIYQAMCPEIGQPIFLKENEIKRELNNIQVNIDNSGGEKFTKVNESSSAKVHFELTVKNNQPLYMYFPTDESKMQEVELVVDGKSIGDYFTVNSYNVVYLGKYNVGDVVSIDFNLKENGAFWNDELFYYQDMEALLKYSNELKKNKMELKEFSDTYFKGTITGTQKRDKLFLSIPYDEGWNIKIDNKKVEIKKAFDCMMMVDVPKGEHTIELKYIPIGKNIGRVVTLITLICLCVCTIVNCKKMKGKRNEKNKK